MVDLLAEAQSRLQSARTRVDSLRDQLTSMAQQGLAWNDPQQQRVSDQYSQAVNERREAEAYSRDVQNIGVPLNSGTGPSNTTTEKRERGGGGEGQAFLEQAYRDQQGRIVNVGAQGQVSYTGTYAQSLANQGVSITPLGNLLPAGSTSGQGVPSNRLTPLPESLPYSDLFNRMASGVNQARDISAYNQIVTQGKQQRPGFYGLASENLGEARTAGDSKTQQYQRAMGVFGSVLGSQQLTEMGVVSGFSPKAFNSEQSRTALALEFQRSNVPNAGRMVEDTRFNTETGKMEGTGSFMLVGGQKEAQYYSGELQKVIQRPIEASAEYHYVGKSLGIPVPANPYELQADVAVELLKGSPQKDSEFFSPISGLTSQFLPGGMGVQQQAWETARTGTAPRVSFMPALGLFAAAEGEYGPYGSLFGGPRYAGTPSSDGIRKQDPFVLTPDIVANSYAAIKAGGKPTNLFTNATYAEPLGPAMFEPTSKEGRLVGGGKVASVPMVVSTAMPTWEESKGKFTAQQQSMIEWGLKTSGAQASELFAQQDAANKYKTAAMPTDVLGIVGGFERSVFQVGPVNILDTMKSPAGFAILATNPGLAGVKFSADVVAGSPGAQTTEGAKFGAYSQLNPFIQSRFETATGIRAAELEAYAGQKSTGMFETFGASAAATVIREPTQLPTAAAQGVLLSPIFEGIGVASALGGARLGGKISAPAGVMGAKIAERGVPTAIFGGVIAYDVSSGFTDFTEKSMATRAGQIAPSMAAMMTPIVAGPRVSEFRTWREISKASKTPDEIAMVRSLKEIQSLTSGVDTGIRKPAIFEDIKYVGKEGAAPLQVALKKEPGLVFGGTTMQTQMKMPPRSTADVDYMIFRTEAGAEKFAMETATSMGAPFKAEGKLITREMPGETRTPHAVDIHTFMERSGNGGYSTPFKMDLPVSRVVTIKGISYEPLYLQSTRKITAALGEMTPSGWDFFPKERAYRTSKDVGDVITVNRAFIEPLQKQSDIFGFVRGRKSERLAKAISEYESNPLVRQYVAEYKRTYGEGKGPKINENPAAPRYTSSYFKSVGPSSFASAMGASQLSSNPSKYSSRMSSAPSYPSSPMYPSKPSAPSSSKMSRVSAPTYARISLPSNPSAPAYPSRPSYPSKPSARSPSRPSNPSMSNPSGPSNPSSSMTYYPRTPKQPPSEPLKFLGGITGSYGDRYSGRMRSTRWVRDNPVADIAYLSRGLGGNQQTRKKGKRKDLFGGSPF